MESAFAVLAEPTRRAILTLLLEEERSVGVELFKPSEAERRQAVEDLLWALINSAEFVFKD